MTRRKQPLTFSAYLEACQNSHKKSRRKKEMKMMASVDWHGKYKTANEAKAHIKHDSREKTEDYANKHIDRSRSHLNFSMLGRSYEERCRIYDETIEDVKNNLPDETYTVKKTGKTTTRRRKLRANAVTLVSLETPAPSELKEEDRKSWFTAVHNIISENLGIDEKYILDSDVHVDEIHVYTDPVTNEDIESRAHMHTKFIPVTKDGRLCAKEICSKENIININNEIHEMTMRDYGIDFMIGGSKNGKTVETLKAESEIARFKKENAELEEENEYLKESISRKSKRNIELVGSNAKLEAKNIELKTELLENSLMKSHEKHDELYSYFAEYQRKIEEQIKNGEIIPDEKPLSMSERIAMLKGLSIDDMDVSDEYDPEYH